MTKLERFRHAFDYLHSLGKYHNKSECAKQLGRARAQISGAYNGREPFFNDSFLIAFCHAYPEISCEWMLEGRGEMLSEPQKPVQPVQPGIENMLDIYASIIRRIDDMKAELAKELDAVRTEREELRREREEFRKLIYGTYIPAEPKYYATAEKETDKATQP